MSRNLVDEWVKKARSQFEATITITDKKQQFARWKVDVKDPYGKAQDFNLYFDEGRATILQMKMFRFDRFNIAEGYTSDDILKAAQAILDGTLKIKQSAILHRPMVCFSTSLGVVYGKYKTRVFDKIVGFRKKY